MLSLALALVLAAPSITPPPLIEAPPSVSSSPRHARLSKTWVEPSASGELLGRAMLAPLGGAIGGGLGATIGMFGGAALASGWASLGTAVLGGVVLGLIGGITGIALGASLFGEHQKDLFGPSFGWAVLAVGVSLVVTAVAFLVAAPIAIAVSIGTFVVTSASVPLIVEARRLANAEDPRAPEALVPVTTF